MEEEPTGEGSHPKSTTTVLAHPDIHLQPNHLNFSCNTLSSLSTLHSTTLQPKSEACKQTKCGCNTMQIRASQANLHSMQSHAKTHAEMYAWLHPLVQAELSVAAMGPRRVCCAPDTDKCYNGCCCISTSLRVSDQSFKFCLLCTVHRLRTHGTQDK
jgi:hypothetical protein